MHKKKAMAEAEKKLVDRLVDTLRGELHESLYVGQGAEGTTRMAYVPADWKADVTEWVRRHQRVRKLLDRLSERAWRALRRRER